MVEALAAHLEGGVWIERDEVGVAARSDPALSRREAGETRRRFRHPLGEPADRDPPPLRLRPHDGQRELQRRDTAPRGHEVALLLLLERGRARRVIGDDEADRPVHERVPERVLVGALAHGRRALELGAPVADLLGREREVVRAGLGAERQAVAPRLGDERGGARGGEVDDVDLRAQLAAQPQEQCHRLPLPGRRTRLQVRGVSPGVAGRGRRVVRKLGVDEERLAALGEDGQRPAQVGLGRRRKVVDPRVDQERLHAAGARVEELPHLGGVARDEPAPEGALDAPASGGRVALALEGVPRGRHGAAVERHVHERRHAAGRRRARRAVEAFPFGAARLVHVHVAVHEPGQQHEIAHVLNWRSGRHRTAVHDRRDPLAAHENGPRALAFGRHDAL